MLGVVRGGCSTMGFGIITFPSTGKISCFFWEKIWPQPKNRFRTTKNFTESIAPKKKQHEKHKFAAGLGGGLLGSGGCATF